MCQVKKRTRSCQQESGNKLILKVAKITYFFRQFVFNFKLWSSQESGLLRNFSAVFTNVFLTLTALDLSPNTRIFLKLIFFVFLTQKSSTRANQAPGK